MNPLEQRFDQAMHDIYRRAREECDYHAARFRQMLGEQGGLETARRLLSSDEISDGFTEMALLDRLDLTMETLVLQDYFRELFTEQELSRARERLGTR